MLMLSERRGLQELPRAASNYSPPPLHAANQNPGRPVRGFDRPTNLSAGWTRNPAKSEAFGRNPSNPAEFSVGCGRLLRIFSWRSEIPFLHRDEPFPRFAIGARARRSLCMSLPRRRAAVLSDCPGHDHMAPWGSAVSAVRVVCGRPFFTPPPRLLRPRTGYSAAASKQGKLPLAHQI